MREISLTNTSKKAIVDDDSFDIVGHLPWCCDRDGYAIGTSYHGGVQRTVIMHRMIMGMKRGDGLVVDHINHDALDNRKSNLRVCSHYQNMLNKKPKVFGPQLPVGVSQRTGSKKFRARIGLGSKQIHLGDFDSIAEARTAYEGAANRFHPCVL